MIQYKRRRYLGEYYHVDNVSSLGYGNVPCFMGDVTCMEFTCFGFQPSKQGETYTRLSTQYDCHFSVCD